MPRRIALALSLALTVVVAFAVASFASQAGWLQAQSNPEPEVSNAENAPLPSAQQALDIEPIVITEYVYEDVPVVVSRRGESEPEKVVTPEPNSQSKDSVGTAVPSFASTGNSQEVNPQPSLNWSHDGDGEDDEDFGDEIKDHEASGDQEQEHEGGHEREDD